MWLQRFLLGVYKFLLVLGIRNGYRDIRVEFEVKPGELQRIDVRCDESIEASL